MGLFLCLLFATPSHAQNAQGSTETLGPTSGSATPYDLATTVSASPSPSPRLSAAVVFSMYESRPASVVINRIELQGDILASDPAFRPWSKRVTPITIRYPGIDLASGVFQDKSLAETNAFNNWLAEKWMERNTQCNNVFQRSPKVYAWEEFNHHSVPQCSELNRPIQQLIAECDAPRTAQYKLETLLLRWTCKLASNTAPRSYEEAIPSPGIGTIIAVNPASGESVRISIESVE